MIEGLEQGVRETELRLMVSEIGATTMEVIISCLHHQLAHIIVWMVVCFGVWLVALVPIPFCGNKVLMGMDWLSPNGEVIDCEQQLVRVQILSGGEIVIQGERP